MSSVAAALRFIVILLPDPAYITEYIEDPFDTVRIVGDSSLTIRNCVLLIYQLNNIHVF